MRSVMDRSDEGLDFLAHHGILGMHWGVRKPDSVREISQRKEKPQRETALEVQLKGGGTLTVKKVPPSRFVQKMSSLFPNSTYAKENANYHSFTLHNAEGKKVGEASFFQDSPTSLELEWIGVKSAHRNNGYASAAVSGVIKYAQDRGITTLHLTATDMGEPIYTKLGFVPSPKKTGKSAEAYNAAFGHVTDMVLNIPQKHLQHIDTFDYVQYIVDAINEEDPEVESLAHHGILGMHWGIRKPESDIREGRNSSFSKPKVTKDVKISETKDTKIKKGDIVVLGVTGAIPLYVAGYTAAASGQKAIGKLGASKFSDVIAEDLQKIKENTAVIDKGKLFTHKVDTNVPMNTVFHRVASYQESEINGPKYATYLRDDVLRYRHTWVTPGKTDFSKHYVTKMTALKDVTIASPNSIEKTIIKHIHDTLSDGETLFEKYAKTGVDLGWYPKTPSVYQEALGPQLAEHIISHNRIHIWADDVGKATSEIMQKAGYAAVTDINNTGIGGRKHAVIVLDKEAFDVTSTRLTQAERAAVGIAIKKLATATV